MNLTRSLITALLLFLALMVVWEYLSRQWGYIAALDDDKALWAVQRGKLEKLSSNDIVVLGSSRAHFDIQLNSWEQETGVRPLMLACDGSTPTPIFQDIVNNTSFNGTILIGVTPGLFFSAPVEQAPMWKRPLARVNHYYDRTYAQRLNHYLSRPLEESFAFLTASEEQWADDIDLKTLIHHIRIGERLGEPAPPFYNFGYVNKDRNTTMFDKTVTDTAFASTIKKVWMFFISDAPPPVKDTILSMYKDLVQQFTGRGGSVIFVRFPSSGGFREVERNHVPRTEFWDALIQETKMPGYHFEDYAELNQYVIPEWSHLATPDAQTFTRDLVAILSRDNVITKKINP